MAPKLTAPIAMLALIASAASLAHASVVNFDNSVVIATDAALDAPLGYSGASLVQAVNFGTTGQTVTTPNQSINFVQGTINGGAPAGTATVLFRSGSENNAALFSGDTGDAGLNAILRSQGWANSGSSASPQTLRIGGLTDGQSYVVQLLASDMRSGSAGRTQRYNDASNYSGNQSDSFSVQQARYVLATFVADASGFQDIFVEDTRGSSPPWDTTFAGFTLYSYVQVPAPAALPAGFALLGAAAIRRPRRY